MTDTEKEFSFLGAAVKWMIKGFLKTVEKDDPEYAHLKTAGNVKGKLHYKTMTQASVLYSHGRLKEAKDLLLMHIADMECVEPYSLLMKILFSLQDLERVELFLPKLQTLDEAEYHLWRGRWLYHKKGDSDSVFENLKNYFEKSRTRGDVEAHEIMAELLEEKEDFDGAHVYLERALNIKPEKLFLHERLAGLNKKMGLQDKADAHENVLSLFRRS